MSDTIPRRQAAFREDFRQRIARLYNGPMHVFMIFAIGIATAMTWNFFWNRRVTFADAAPSPIWRQYLGFCASCSLGALISWNP